MEHLQPAEIDPSELPEGFSTVAAAAAGGGAGGGAAAAQREAAAAEQRQAVLEQALTGEALARLRRIKLVRPAQADRLERSIAALALAGRLPGPMSEAKLIELLERDGSSRARPGGGGGGAGAAAAAEAISIQRKKYAMDSDDENDNDDDLY